MEPQPTKPNKLTKEDRVSLPMTHIPSFRVSIAVQNAVQNRLLFVTWGGLGDQICAEPTLRFALKSFKESSVYLASEQVSLFRHLTFKRTFNLKDKDDHPVLDNYLLFHTITPPDDTNLVWQFFSHMLTNCVDFPSLCALRCQLPVEDREILMVPEAPKASLPPLLDGPTVLIHAGKHWPSKTFPKDWWDAVIHGLLKEGVRPILIGANTDDNRGTVDVDTAGCLDLRNALSINDSLWLCQRADVLLTNDSSPLHMAASRNPFDETTGKTWIGFIATCKHPDFISHWRQSDDVRYEGGKHGPNGKLVWNWREENLGLDGAWNHMSQCPNVDERVDIDQIDPELLRSWLPEPKSVVAWTKDKLER